MQGYGIVPAVLPPEPIRPTGLGKRFCGFATGHFCLSLCAVGLWLMGAAALMGGAMGSGVVLAVLLMGAYFPMGAYAAAEGEWTPPADDRERLLAVLQPALVAWAWAGLVLLVLFGVVGGDGEEWMLMVFYLSFLLAAPSSAFVLLCMAFGGMLGLWVEPALGWAFTAFFAGLLPPLLFAWGSFWQSGRMARRAAEEKDRSGSV